MTGPDIAPVPFPRRRLRAAKIKNPAELDAVRCGRGSRRSSLTQNPATEGDRVRHQRSLDRTGGLNKGEFLAHRNVHRSEDETANPTIEGTG